MKKILYYSIIAILFIACKKPYNPAVINSPKSYLVVEGVINADDTTKIVLSKSVNLSTAGTSNPVLNATLSVEGDDNSIYNLVEEGNGAYMLTGVSLNNSSKYRLRMKLEDGRQYISDFEQVKLTPPIESIGFKVQGSGLEIYANTHDLNNNTHYYRFEYNETWAFHAKYHSNWEAMGVDVQIRPEANDIYHCFAGNASSTIILGSSEKLSSDVLFQQPITAIDSTSEKVETKYSILVKEYALSADAYKFYTNIKKNTEKLGSIFDAEPSQISGNIHNVTDATETVIGFMGVGTVQSKRIFITAEQLPSYWRPRYPYNCELTAVLYRNKYGTNEVLQFLLGVPPQLIPVSDINSNASLKPIGYQSTSKECVDCTIRGFKRQPAFWK